MREVLITITGFIRVHVIEAYLVYGIETMPIVFIILPQTSCIGHYA